jgi:hypothetical protein
MRKLYYVTATILILALIETLDPAEQSPAAAQGMQMEHGAQSGKAQHGHQMAHMATIAKTSKEGMEISLMTADPESFFLLQGEKMKTIEKKPGDTFHMMVLLRDQQNGWFIPNTAVWMTIKDAKGTVVFDERMWPMLAERIHYGNNVALPGPGHYGIEVQIGAPQLARHRPYQEKWLKPFKVVFEYDYRKPTAH